MVSLYISIISLVFSVGVLIAVIYGNKRNDAEYDCLVRLIQEYRKKNKVDSKWEVRDLVCNSKGNSMVQVAKVFPNRSEVVMVEFYVEGTRDIVIKRLKDKLSKAS